jgi:hypothetical protein
MVNHFGGVTSVEIGHHVLLGFEYNIHSKNTQRNLLVN